MGSTEAERNRGSERRRNRHVISPDKIPVDRPQHTDVAMEKQMNGDGCYA